MSDPCHCENTNTCAFCTRNTLDEERCQMYCNTQRELLKPKAKWTDILDSLDAKRCKRRHCKNSAFCKQHLRQIVKTFDPSQQVYDMMRKKSYLEVFSNMSPLEYLSVLMSPVAILSVSDQLLQQAFLAAHLTHDNDTTYGFLFDVVFDALRKLYAGASNLKEGYLFIAYTLILRVQYMIIDCAHPTKSNLIPPPPIMGIPKVWEAKAFKVAKGIPKEFRELLFHLLQGVYGAFGAVYASSETNEPRASIFHFDPVYEVKPQDTKAYFMERVLPELLDDEEVEEKVEMKEVVMVGKGDKVGMGGMGGKQPMMPMMPKIPKMPQMTDVNLDIPHFIGGTPVIGGSKLTEEN